VCVECLGEPIRVGDCLPAAEEIDAGSKELHCGFGVAVCSVRVLQRDAEMIAKDMEFAARDVGAGMSRQLHRTETLEFWRGDSEASKLGLDETTVEAHVVRDKICAAEQTGDVTRNLAETRGFENIARVDSMQICGADIAVGIDKRGVLVDHLAASVETNDSDLENAVGSLWEEAGRF
jgi:hypothetical protein